MNIEKAIDILKNSIADYVIGEYCEKCADNKICDDRNEDCYYQQAIDIVVTAYEKEKEKNFKRSDMCFLLKSENTKLKDEVKTLENADLTTVYINGFYDGEKKVENKIKAKIEEIEKSPYWADCGREYEKDIELLKELLGDK